MSWGTGDNGSGLQGLLIPSLTGLSRVRVGVSQMAPRVGSMVGVHSRGIRIMRPGAAGCLSSLAFTSHEDLRLNLSSPTVSQCSATGSRKALYSGHGGFAVEKEDF